MGAGVVRVGARFARSTPLTPVLAVNGRGWHAVLRVDDDVKRRALKGLIGFQLHTGPPMKVEYRNIGLKTL